jgi:hypothetical protein
MSEDPVRGTAGDGEGEGSGADGNRVLEDLLLALHALTRRDPVAAVRKFVGTAPLCNFSPSFVSRRHADDLLSGAPFSSHRVVRRCRARMGR